LVKTFADKFFSDKMSEAERGQLDTQAEMFVVSEARDQDSSFRQFVVDYEGAAKDVPRFIVVFRSSIRPLFTCLVGYFDWIFFTGSTTSWHPDAITFLKAVNILVLGFWFGERALKNSGIVDILLKKKNG
ncbi:MAG: hypothetical protein KAW09_04670, partial [Thermoplasmata archaeon]|nr:hypothetical protein [Thermoplasmata archaeon]